MPRGHIDRKWAEREDGLGLVRPLTSESNQDVVDLSVVVEISKVLRAPKLPSAISHHGV
jgi:hypothetical protein